jgi:hypothetical protein
MTTATRQATHPDHHLPACHGQLGVAEGKRTELRDAGILTSEEFEAKKADLLQRL